MSNHKSFRKLWTVIPVFIAFAFLLIIPSTAIILISNNSYFDTINIVYGQPNQMNFVTDLPNIQNIPAKKVHVGDIDIAYNILGKGDPILLISGASADMNAWEPSTLRDLSSNHTVLVFDNRGVGNITTGYKPYSIYIQTSPLIKWQK